MRRCSRISWRSSHSPREVDLVRPQLLDVHRTEESGSLLADLDVHPRVAMQIPLHSKITVTMEICTEVPSADAREALRKLGQQLPSPHYFNTDRPHGCPLHYRDTVVPVVVPVVVQLELLVSVASPCNHAPELQFIACWVASRGGAEPEGDSRSGPPEASRFGQPPQPGSIHAGSGRGCQGARFQRGRRLRSSVSVPCSSNSIAREYIVPDSEGVSSGLSDRRSCPVGLRGERRSEEVAGQFPSSVPTATFPSSVPTTTRASSVSSCIPSNLARTSARMTISPCCELYPGRLRNRKDRTGAFCRSAVPSKVESWRPDPGTSAYARCVRWDCVLEE